jgi:uncharacterized protein YjbI with pentapeptide repeats
MKTTISPPDVVTMKRILLAAKSQFQNPSASVVAVLVCLFTPIGANAQIDPVTGTGTVGGHFIGPGITRSNINLSNADLKGANLSGANFTDVDLSGADLRDANLTDAIFTRVDLRNANLTETNVANADLIQLQVAGAQVGPLNGTPKFVGIQGGSDVQVGPDVNGKRWIFAPDVRMHHLRIRLGAAFQVWEQNLFFAGIARTEFINAEWIGDMIPPRSLNTLNLTGLKTSHATITFREGPAPNFTPQIVYPPSGWFQRSPLGSKRTMKPVLKLLNHFGALSCESCEKSARMSKSNSPRLPVPLPSIHR